MPLPEDPGALPEDLARVWREADLDKSETLTFAEVVCLLNPTYTSLDLRGRVPALQDPGAHFQDPGRPAGMRATTEDDPDALRVTMSLVS